MQVAYIAQHARIATMDLMLVMTAVAAIVSCLTRAMGPRPSGWAEIPDLDIHSFTASFGLEHE